MDIQRVPNLDWPKDLFSRAIDDNLIDDEDNPFLEASDFIAGGDHFAHGVFACSSHRELAM